MGPPPKSQSEVDPNVVPFIKREPLNVYQPCYPATPVNGTENVLERIVTSVDSIITKTSFPPMEVVKFSADPSQFFQFKARFHNMVDSQSLSESQKMSRLLQFLDGKARKAVAGFEGVPGGLPKAMGILEQRFGQPHMVAKACVDTLVEGANIPNRDSQGLQEFADQSRTLYETLASMNALSEMNMTSIGKMSGRMPVVYQIKWRDEVQRIREKGRLPTLKDLVEFVEKRADAANDPVFGRIGETNKTTKYLSINNRRPMTSGATAVGAKITTLTTQVGPQDRSQPSTVVKASSEYLHEGRSGGPHHATKCVDCGAAHKPEDCHDFRAKSVRQKYALARVKGLCLNCLKNGHFAGQCQAKSQCNSCQQRHHTLLHKKITSNDDAASDEEQRSAGSVTVGAVNIFDSGCSRASREEVAPRGSRVKIALQVVPVRVLGANGNAVDTYALLDSGSEESFLTKSLADKLALEVKDYDTLVVCTLSGESTVRVGRVDLTVEPVVNPETRQVMIQDAKVIEKLNIRVSRPKDLSKWTHLRGLNIPKVDDDEVTLLIGANVPEVQVHEESRVGTTGEPYAVRTILGWAILGPVNETQQSRKVNVNFLRYGDDMLDRQMDQFLALDNVGVTRSDKKKMSIED